MTSTKGDLTQLRREYVAQGLEREAVNADPVKKFAEWIEVAQEHRPDDASSMTLATASSSGRPAARIVLLKHFGDEGFAWYTDYESSKGKELEENPQAELLFYWYGMERQIRIQGRVEKLTRAQADQYFHERPRGSQLSAAISHQSHPVDTRAELEEKVVALDNQYESQEIPCPERWGGYRLIPDHFEFWQGRENRLHDRFVFDLNNDVWGNKRLQP